MAKRAREKRPKPIPLPALATAARFDGGALRIEFVMQPQAAAQPADQIVNALLAGKGEAKDR